MAVSNHTANEIGRAERLLKATLATLNLPVRGSYSSGEVCAILGISNATFWRLLKKYQRDDNGRLINPESLESFIINSHRRVNFVELVDFIRRNNAWQREATQLPQGSR